MVPQPVGLVLQKTDSAGQRLSVRNNIPALASDGGVAGNDHARIAVETARPERVVVHKVVNPGVSHLEGQDLVRGILDPRVDRIILLRTPESEKEQCKNQPSDLHESLLQHV